MRISKEGMSKHFAQDLPSATRALMAATQGPIQTKACAQKLTAAAWKTKPCWYLVADAVRMIQPAFQLAMARNIRARIVHVNAGHVPQQSQPDRVAALILEAAAQQPK
jgi:pimeloyl-ACP methyl ester carboxylesterase